MQEKLVLTHRMCRQHGQKKGLGALEINCVVCARPICTHSLLKFLQVVGLFKATTGETGVAVGSFVWP